MDHPSAGRSGKVTDSKEQVVKVVKDFHPLPAGRYLEDGPGNGTTFREKFLVPALQQHRDLLIDLDDAPGYPSSFLEEAFGGLVRLKFSPEVIRKFLRFRVTDPADERYIRRIWEHVERAAAAVH